MTSFSTKSNSSSVNRVGTLGGYADRTRVTLRYVETFSISTATVAASSYVFSGNGIFDPNVTSTGGQPVNYDDFAAVYLRYRVWGSKLTVHCATEFSTENGVRLVTGPRHTSTNITTVATSNDFVGQPYSKFHHHVQYRNGDPDSVSHQSMTTRKFLGLSKTEFEGNDDLAALTSAQPSHQWFWHINQSNINTGETVVSYFTAIVDYDVEFWDRVDTTLDLAGQILRLQRMLQSKGGKDDETSSQSVELKQAGGRQPSKEPESDEEEPSSRWINLKPPKLEIPTPGGTPSRLRRDDGKTARRNQ